MNKVNIVLVVNGGHLKYHAEALSNQEPKNIGEITLCSIANQVIDKFKPFAEEELVCIHRNEDGVKLGSFENVKERSVAVEVGVEYLFALLLNELSDIDKSILVHTTEVASFFSVKMLSGRYTIGGNNLGSRLSEYPLSDFIAEYEQALQFTIDKLTNLPEPSSPTPEQKPSVKDLDEPRLKFSITPDVPFFWCIDEDKYLSTASDEELERDIDSGAITVSSTNVDKAQVVFFYSEEADMKNCVLLSTENVNALKEWIEENRIN